MACEHTTVYDAVLTAEKPDMAIRQCADCRWWTKVYDHARQQVERGEVLEWYKRHGRELDR